MQLVSSAFGPGDQIPRRYCCDGDDLSIPLSWSGLPDGTRSIAIIMDDPDAPVGTWLHWMLWDLDSQVCSLPEGVPRNPEGPAGSIQGLNDFGRPGYGGPCPPRGTHRYFIRVYALDAPLQLGPRSDRSILEAAMQDHLLDSAGLMGIYTRRN